MPTHILGAMLPDGTTISVHDLHYFLPSCLEEKTGYPYEYLMSIVNNPREYSYEPTVTSMLGCQMAPFIKSTTPFYINLKYHFSAWRGTMIHLGIHTDMVEFYEMYVTREKRLYLTLDCGLKISGQPDWYYWSPENQEIRVRDYKTVSSLPTEPDIKHCIQVNLYAYLVYCAEGSSQYNVTQLDLVYISNSGTRIFPVKIKPMEWCKSTLEKLGERWQRNEADPKPTRSFFCKMCDVRKECDERTGNV